MSKTEIKPNGIPAFHGELSLRAVDSLPSTAVAVSKHDSDVYSPAGPDVIIGHSESGHHHVATSGTLYRDNNNPLITYLVTKGPVDVVHQKEGADRHADFELLGNGSGEVIWEIGNAREWSPAGWQKAID
jgi:hypothetical protein